MLLVLGAAVVFVAIVRGRAPYGPVIIGVLALMIACMIIFSTMTIRATASEIEWWLTLPVLRGHIPLKDVKSVAETILYPLPSFGIHTNGRDWTWIVSGRNLVVITLKNDKRIRLGTDDAPGLIRAINSKVA